MTISLWTVYNRPPEYPHHVVVREHLIDRGRVYAVPECALYATYEDARESLFTRGLTCLPRQPGDDPLIVENWL